MIKDVRAFHAKFGLLVHDTPVHLTRRKLAECANLMLEGLRRFADAAGLDFENGEFHADTPNDQDLESQANALVNLVYAALDTAVQLGLPWTELWDEVHRAKMAMLHGGSVKPPRWEAPHTDVILAEAGYDREDFRSYESWPELDERLCKDDKL